MPSRRRSEELAAFPRAVLPRGACGARRPSRGQQCLTLSCPTSPNFQEGLIFRKDPEDPTAHCQRDDDRHPAHRCDDVAGLPDFHELLQKLADAHELALARAGRRASCSSCPVLEAGPLPRTSSRLHAELLTPPDLPGQQPPTPSESVITRMASCTSSGPGKNKQDLKLLRVWNGDPVSEAGSTSVNQVECRCSSSLTPRAKLDVPATPKPQAADPFDGASWLQRLVIHPGSFKRLAWDVTSMMFLAYDIIMIPFSQAFDPQEVFFTIAMGYCTLFYWSLDVVVSMLTGYHNGKGTVLEPTRILKRYLRTWFMLDAFLVGLDWTLVAQDKRQNSTARLGRSLRILRFARTLRLVRLLKVNRILLEIQDQINTEALSICFRVLKIILFLVLSNHVLACAWYGIGKSGGTDVDKDGLSTWIIENRMEDMPLVYKYVTSLHWSLTQFTPASMEVQPRNVRERVFAVVVLLFAMVMFSSFVSLLTASMAELRNISSDETRQFWLLRRYLRDWHVSSGFARRLQRYLEYAYHKQRQRVQAKDVKLLALLSGPLHDELRAETLSRPLDTHPLFFKANRCLHVFSGSLSDMHFCRGDCAFYYGERGSSMLFVCSGVFSYHLGQQVDSSCDVVSSLASTRSTGPQHVTEGQWVAEAVLWTSWLHMGDLQALTEGQVIRINAQKFGEAVAVFRPSWLAFRSYAQRFLKALNRIDQKELTDLLHHLIEPRMIVDSSGFVEDGSMYQSEDNQELGFFQFSRIFWNRLTARCTQILGRRDKVKEGPAFAGMAYQDSTPSDSMPSEPIA